MNAPQRPLHFGEFIALLGLLFATVAFSTDAMLPLLGQIGTDLNPADPARVQLVVGVFLAGLGLGTLVAGPLSDAFGRKRVILGGIGLYMLAALVAALSQSLEMLLAARLVQGIGAAAPRVVSQALVRDLYQGRMMARVMSFAMTLFVLVPAVAPFIGAMIGAAFGWRAIFLSFLVFGLISGSWLAFRQPETLPPAARRPLNIAALLAALKEVFRNARVMWIVVALTCAFAGMVVWLSSVAPLFEDRYDRAASFPAWFAFAALVSAPASLLNARLVLRLGMQRLVIAALVVQLGAALFAAFVLPRAGGAEFGLFVAFMTIHFAAIGLIFGNLNALALVPLGHIAGMAASVVSGLSTVMAALVAIPVSLAYDGTTLPLALAAFVFALGALGAMARVARLDPDRLQRGA